MLKRTGAGTANSVTRGNEVLKAVLGELHAAGIRDVTVAAGGKAPTGSVLRGRARGACSPRHAPRVTFVLCPNAPSDIRRLLRSLGLLIPEERSAPARQPSRLELLEQRLARVEARIASLETCPVG